MPRWNTYTEDKLSQLTRVLKRRRVELFVRTLELGPHARILDLGSEDGSYLASFYPFPSNIVLADVGEFEPAMRRGVSTYGLAGYRVIAPDAALPFDDTEFDAVWCNSVIEHVTFEISILATISNKEFRRGAEAHQRFFADEISRIGRHYFVQTPYIHFPIESHSWLPLIQVLPHPWRWRLARVLKRVWIKQWHADFYLYDIPRLRAHFPTSREVLVERVCGVPKSLIAVR